MATVKEVTEKFIASGWNKNIVLAELSEEEAMKNHLNTNKQYFRMESTGNIYFESGMIALFKF